MPEAGGDVVRRRESPFLLWKLADYDLLGGGSRGDRQAIEIIVVHG